MAVCVPLIDALTEALQDAHAMEVEAFESAESLIATTQDPAFLEALRTHRRHIHRHARRLEELLRRHGKDTSSAKDAGGTLKATVKGFADQLRGPKPLKNARDAYGSAHAQIAAYALLERLAQRAGDTQAAAVARDNRHDEEAMAAWIAARWDRFVDVTVGEPPRVT
jgi:ferritin-like metal-binding protein YciE